MMTSNNALVPDPDKSDILASKPFDWPFLRLGLRMCGWGDNQVKYYLIGNPVIWWGSTIALGVGLGSVLVFLMRMQRQYQDWTAGESGIDCLSRTDVSERGGDCLTHTTAVKQLDGMIICLESRYLLEDGRSNSVSMSVISCQSEEAPSH